MTSQPTRVPLCLHVAVLTVSVQEHSVDIFITDTKAVSRSRLRGRLGGFPKLLNTNKPSRGGLLSTSGGCVRYSQGVFMCYSLV